MKPENILIDENWHLKLTDFGEAVVFGPDGKIKKGFELPSEQEERKATDDPKEHMDHPDFVDMVEKYREDSVYRGTFVGTPLYVAPEMLKESISGVPTDLWALGCMLF